MHLYSAILLAVKKANKTYYVAAFRSAALPALSWVFGSWHSMTHPLRELCQGLHGRQNAASEVEKALAL